MEENHICIARKCFFSSGLERNGQGNAGHNYTFEVFVYGPIDPVTGLVINLTDVNIILASITKQLDQKHLNYDLKLNSVEQINIHEYIHERFAKEFKTKAPKNISFLKSKLLEGHFDETEIITTKGQEYFK